MSAELARRLMAADAAAGAAAESRAVQQLAVRASTEFASSDVDIAEGEDGAVFLHGRALRVRAFGSRYRAPDARFAGLLATLARGEPR